MFWGPVFRWKKNWQPNWTDIEPQSTRNPSASFWSLHSLLPKNNCVFDVWERHTETRVRTRYRCIQQMLPGKLAGATKKMVCDNEEVIVVQCRHFCLESLGTWTSSCATARRWSYEWPGLPKWGRPRQWHLAHTCSVGGNGCIIAWCRQNIQTNQHHQSC